MISLTIIIVFSYIVGSIPTSIIISRVLRGIDIRDYGSGNAGTTNVYRVMGWKPALLVFIVDAGKGLFATVVISKLAVDQPLTSYAVLQIVAGVSAILGHVWTIFAQFKGGKGVGTALGVVIGIAPIAAVLCLAVWIIVVLTTKYVSLGSLTASSCFPLILLFQKTFFKSNVPISVQIFSLVIAVLVIVTHRSNIKRLIEGKEHHFKKPGQ